MKSLGQKSLLEPTACTELGHSSRNGFDIWLLNVISITIEVSLLKGRQEKKLFPPAFDPALYISCALRRASLLGLI